MFAVGLEFRVARLLWVLPVSGFTGLVQFATLAWAGFSRGALFGWGSVGAAFLGACLAISSTMVVSGIFQQSPVESDVREHVLGVLVVQDVVAIGLIAAMTALAAGHAVGADEDHIEDIALLPGLDHVLALPLPAGAPAVGKTLAQLDLRAKCGATVVAIHKPDAQVVLPTGHERLEAGDVLALGGAGDAIARARALLLAPGTAADLAFD